MSKILLNSLLASPAILAAIVAVSGSAIAAEAAATKEVANTATDTQVLAVTPAAPKANVAPVQIASTPVEAPASVNAADTSLTQINRYVREGRSGNSQDAVTSVSQLTDVKPTDWAFQALESLVQRYGCIAGYPDRKFRGNQAMTRYEFAAGLNSCLDQVNALIAAGTADLAKKEDLETLRKLQQDFAAELATLRGRVDALEARTATLEKQQFSTTTKLAGEVIFAISDELGQPTNNNTVFQDRVRLALNTSFSGKDLLVTRLAAGNAIQFSSLGAAGGAASLGQSPETFQTFNAAPSTTNAISADWVAYFGSLGDKLKFYIPAIGGLHYDYAPTSSPSLDVGDSGSGPLSYFGQRNPIYAIGGGSGLGVNYQLSKDIAVSVGYLANNTVNGNGTNAANNPAVNNGLFTGSYSALAQLAYTGDKFGAGLTYVNAYVNSGGIFNAGVGGGVTGTPAANLSGRTTAVNAFGGEAYFKLSPKIVVNGFFSYIDASIKGLPGGSPTGEIWTYGLGLSFPDLGKKGNLGGIIVGAQPYIGNARQLTAVTGAVNNTTPVHIEGFYKYQLSDNISITPGLIWIINPGQNSANQDVIIGTLRTTFTF